MDIDGNGQLDHDEIIGVLEERGGLGQGKEDKAKAELVDALTKVLSQLREKIGI